MSFEPVLYWRFRCDGETTTGQCGEIYMVWLEDADAPEPVVNTEPSFGEWAQCLAEDGWLAVGDRLLCPRHVQAAEFMAKAAIQGLPFESVGEQ